MDEVATFVRSQPIRRFDKDSIIVYQGEVPSALYAIRSGFIKIYDLSPNGSEQLLGLAGKYDFIPSEALFSSLKSSRFFYAAFTPVEVYMVDRVTFLERLRGNNDALYITLQTVVEKYHELLQHLTAVQKPNAREKIAHVLYFLASYFVSNELAGSPLISLPLTQQDIANLVGVTRETAARELKLLKNEGYISYTKTAFYVTEKLASLIT